MSTVVQHTQDHRGMTTSRCPRCGTQWVYWDEDDLDENGDLRCFCVEDGTAPPDEHGNVGATEGVSRCECGSKYWERDRCADCGTRHDPERHDLDD